MSLPTDIPTITMKQAVPLIIAMYKGGIRNFMINGQMGLGKTQIAQQLADAMAEEFEQDCPCVIFRAGQKSIVDATGVPVADHETKRTKFYAPDMGDIPSEERDGPLGVWCLDEYNTLPKPLQAPSLGMIEDRRIGDTEIPKEWLILATGNRTTDGGYANRLGAPANDRLAMFNIEPDLTSFIEYAYKVELPNVDLIANFLKHRPALLACMPGETSVDEKKDWRVSFDKDARSFPTPRTWFKAAPLLSLKADVREVALASLVGNAVAAEYENWFAVGRDLPQVEEIVANPHGCRLPTEQQTRAGADYMLCMMLAAGATASNIDAICTYASRLSREIEACVFADAGRRDPAIKETGRYVEHVTR